MQNVIHEYIRERVKGKGKQIVGVMAGTVYEGVIVVGWSKANLKAGDVFDRDEGMRIAMDRAKGWINAPATPIQLVEPLRTFQMRCLRYFKQAKSMATGFGGRDNAQALVDKADASLVQAINFVLSMIDNEVSMKNTEKAPSLFEMSSSDFIKGSNDIMKICGMMSSKAQDALNLMFVR